MVTHFMQPLGSAQRLYQTSWREPFAIAPMRQGRIVLRYLACSCACMNSSRMSAYPEKTCSIDRLVRSPNLVQAAIQGEKTQQRRNGVYGYPGETFDLNGVPFVITGLEHRRLGDMSDADASAEGYESLDGYRDFILRVHKGMQWNGNAMVWVHSFRRKGG